MNKTIQYTAAIVTVGILLISVMSIHSQVYASENEKETRMSIATINTPAGDLLGFSVKSISNSDNVEVLMQTTGSNYVCVIPEKEIKISNEDFKIEFNTGDFDCDFALGSTVGLVSLNFERNGEFSEDKKRDNKTCSAKDGEETCIRIQEEFSFAFVDVTGTVLEVSDVNAKGTASVRDTHTKTTIKPFND